MSKLTRRAFITTGIAAGGGLVVGIAMRPGNQVKNLASKLGEGGEGLIHTYVKLDSDNVVTAIVPHSEMGQGVHTALGQICPSHQGGRDSFSRSQGSFWG